MLDDEHEHRAMGRKNERKEGKRWKMITMTIQ